eukprot:gb/GFBE01070620.1/.p1 GENE.gb/GFBE01070620.1/~~gb/GFBE01070620.1/.p1  ORF type:complete len:315 (+),score=46.98 gb/GFBE01070620.1/:1-945(+)
MPARSGLATAAPAALHLPAVPGSGEAKETARKSDTFLTSQSQGSESDSLPPVTRRDADGHLPKVPTPPTGPKSERGRRPVGHLKVMVPEAPDPSTLPAIRAPRRRGTCYSLPARRGNEQITSPRTPTTAPEETVKELGPLHKRALREVLRINAAVRKIQQCWRFKNLTDGGRLRLIFSDAKSRHQKRKTFEEREEVRKDLSKHPHQQPSSPTVWQLQQCPAALREALQDTSSAARIVNAADFAVRHTQSVVQRRKKVAQRFIAQLPKVFAYDAFDDLLEDMRENEAYWVTIMESLKTPKTPMTPMSQWFAEHGI